MRVVALDFETLFSDDYTLKKLTTEAYVRDPRFEAHGAAIKWGPDHAARWYDERQLRQVLAEEDWSDVAILCHHCQFDGLILAHHYSIRPKLWLDTLSMARLLLGNHLSVSLDSVRKHFGMQAKRTPYEIFKGKHWRELTEHEQRLVAEGACDEVESIWTIFGRLVRDFPASEYEVVDLTIRMFTEPVLRADVDLLAKVWTEEETRKAGTKAALGVTEAQLQSAEQFAVLLRAEGVEPAKKKGKHGDIYAFAKTDEFMRELQEDDDPRVRGLAEARLGAKSTLLQTRAETLGFMAGRGALTVYLRYCGAHTTRWSGGDGANFQNFRRGSDLRKAILAPEGYLLGVIDLSQVECRILNYLAGQDDVIERFRNGHDPYVGIASDFYGRRITRADEAERGTGKQLELSCGFGCGPPKFKRVAALGIYGPPVKLTDEQSENAVALYRSTHQKICGPRGYWSEAGNCLSWLNGGLERSWGPMTIKNHRVYLPNGVHINYETLEWHVDPETGEDGWRLKLRSGWTRIWGSKFVQNIVEMNARQVKTVKMVKLARDGFRPVMSSHDELSVLIRDDARAAEALEFCRQEMCREVDWLPGCPLGAEATMGQRYAK